jgi:hypothetical protein
MVSAPAGNINAAAWARWGPTTTTLQRARSFADLRHFALQPGESFCMTLVNIDVTQPQRFSSPECLRRPLHEFQQAEYHCGAQLAFVHCIDRRSGSGSGNPQLQQQRHAHDEPARAHQKLTVPCS